MIPGFAKKFIFVWLLLISAFVNSSANFKNSNYLTIRFYDIGQGDSALIKFPKKLGSFNVLIDTGPDNLILNKLGRDLNPITKRLDLLILSHLHADHVGGALGIIRSYDVGTILLPSSFNDTEIVRELLKEIENRKIPVIKGLKGDYFNNNNASFSLLWPPKDLQASTINETSLIPYLKYSNFKMLFLSDLEKYQFEELDFFDNVDIVKVPHQGAENAFVENFYKLIDPEVAIISVGKNNFGHPSDKVLNYFQTYKALLYRTDKNGDVTLKTDGFRYQISSQRD